MVKKTKSGEVSGEQTGLAPAVQEKAGNGSAVRRKAVHARSVSREKLMQWFEETLTPQHFKDYCPNGLQIQGAQRIGKLAFAVTASRASIDAAVAQGAQALLVHHGYFWRGEDPCLTGLKYQRIAPLIKNDINLIAYHLPLDAHPVLGNNAQLALHMGWHLKERVGEYGLISTGVLPSAIDAKGLARQLKRSLGHAALLVGDMKRPIRRIGWCTGAAQDMLEEAIAAGCDAFISGEISERTTHLAREAGVIYAAAGHHATERYGVQALGRAASEAFGIEWVYLDDPNPV